MAIFTEIVPPDADNGLCGASQCIQLKVLGGNMVTSGIGLMVTLAVSVQAAVSLLQNGGL